MFFFVCLIIKKTGTRSCIYKTRKIYQSRKPDDSTSFCVIELDCTRPTKYKQRPSPKATETCFKECGNGTGNKEQ